MAAIAGYGGKIMLGATGGVNTVASVKDWDIPLAAQMYDVSALGNQWQLYLPGLTGANAKCGVFFDPTDTNGLIAIQNAFLAGTALTFNFYVNSTHYYAGSAFIKGLDVKDPVGGPIEASIDVQFSGAISYT